MRARPTRLRIGLASMLTVTLFAAIVPRPILAQSAADPGATTDAQSEAEASIRHGVELRRQGNDEAALVEFQRAHALAPTPRALVQIAMAEQALGHWLDADAHLREGLLATNDRWIQSNLAALQAPLEVIDRHLGSLEVSANVDGAELWINDRRTATLPLATPLRMVTGTAVLEVRLAGFQTARRSVEIDAGGLARESFTLVALRPPEPELPLPPRQRAIDQRPRSIDAPATIAGPAAMFAVGTVSFGAAGLFWGLRQNAIRNCELDPSNNERLICASAVDVREAAAGRTFTALTNVAVIAGAASVVAGAIWAVVRTRSLPATTSSRASVWLVPLSGGMIFGLEGRL